MNKNPAPKSEHAATPDAKPAPVAASAVKITKVRAAAAPKPAAAAKTVRVGRPPAAKQAVVKKAVVRKSAKNTAAQPVAAKPAAAAKEKAKKAKLVRDSFTMPETEYEVLGKVKKASLKAGFNVKKSELLRIGVVLVDQLNTAQLQDVLAHLTPLKAGRPKKDK
ncbi:hypothetical protein [Herminiimonas sp. CN]|uniref:hypothetical protein n=1 Tax=Herminiimonas sp. CN TaxID=1349818 RepID=UPI000473DB37|nr:hypothetical protein [Herminiimonas sp. CN]